jgi:tRNA dimethylallyltransferase
VKKLIVLVGPTAVGKTAAAISIAEKLGTEIISADSRQLYKELNIGTAKPSQEELSRVRHHFIGNKSIYENYNAGKYSLEAFSLIEVLFKKHDWLVMVGGSGLYIKATLEGFDAMPMIPEGLRTNIIEEYRAKGLTWLQAEVEHADPDYFETMDQQNPQRLMRALEIFRASGSPLNSFRNKQKKELPFEVAKIGLNAPREVLYDRIDSRMDKMIEAGLFEEAKQFYPDRNNNALHTVGYSEIFGYFDGQYDYEEAVRLLKRNSRRYAKRQLTWFLRDNEIMWFESERDILNWLESQIVPR